MATVSRPKQLQRNAAMAQLEVEELRARLAERHAAAEGESQRDALAELNSLLAEIGALADRITEALDARTGLSVEQVARRLMVTTPTVRKWLAEGLLEPVPGRKPVEVDPRSVVVVERMLARVRQNFPSRDWTKALAAYLHDQHVQQDGGFQRGAEEAQRGDFVER